MNKNDKKQIAKLIKGLPEMYHKSDMINQTVYGNTLIERGVVKLKNGDAIDPKKRYIRPVPRTINHRTEAERNFKKGGLVLVEKYCEAVIRINSIPFTNSVEPQLDTPLVEPNLSVQPKQQDEAKL